MWGQIVLEHVNSLYIIIKYASYKAWSFKHFKPSFLVRITDFKIYLS